MPVPFWVGHYIGLTFIEHGREAKSGLDCWGLYRLVLGEQFGLALPSYHAAYISTKDGEKLSEIITAESAKWRPITAGSEKLGDAVILRLRGHPMHIGLVIGDGQMLHIENKIDSAIESYTGPRWKNRVVAFFRHQELESRP